MRLIVGKSSRRRWLRSPTRRNCCLFISSDGFGITEAARRYLAPLIIGEAYPPFRNGLPDYVKLRNVAVPKSLTREFAV
jgi:hypothetical protein